MSTEVDPAGRWIRYYGSGVNDNDVLFETDDITAWDVFSLMSTAGEVDVLVSLDGVNFSNTALSIQDFGAATLDPALVTVALRPFGWLFPARRYRVLQNGASAASASLFCKVS